MRTLSIQTVAQILVGLYAPQVGRILNGAAPDHDDAQETCFFSEWEGDSVSAVIFNRLNGAAPGTALAEAVDLKIISPDELDATCRTFLGIWKNFEPETRGNGFWWDVLEDVVCVANIAKLVKTTRWVEENVPILLEYPHLNSQCRDEFHKMLEPFASGV